MSLLFVGRLLQGLRSSQGKEFKSEINATIDKSYAERKCVNLLFKTLRTPVLETNERCP